MRKLASRFPNFFEKLGELLSQLARRVPQYRKLAYLTNLHTSELLTSSLRALYVDLLEFFGGIAKVFTQRDGSMSHHQFRKILY